MTVFPSWVGMYSMPPLTYVWMKDSAGIQIDTIRIDNNMFGPSFHGNLSSGNYIVSLTDANGCWDSVHVEIRQNSPIMVGVWSLFGSDNLILPCGTGEMLLPSFVYGGGTFIDTSLFWTTTMYLDSINITGNPIVVTTPPTMSNSNYFLVISGTFTNNTSDSLDAFHDD